MVSEVTPEVWRRDEQLFDLRTELSLEAPHAEDVYATTESRIRWKTSAVDRIGSGDSNIERCLKNLELLNRPLDQKSIDIGEDKNSHEKYHVKMMKEHNLRDNYEGIGHTWSPLMQDLTRIAIDS